MNPARNDTFGTAKLFASLALSGLLLAGLTGCPPSYPDCDDDSTCRPKGEVCVAQKCRQCRDDSQCQQLDACMICQANECVKRQGCCKSALDCPGGKCWRDSSDPAAAGTCGGDCQTNEHCPKGQRCARGTCVPDIACTDDAFCPDGQKCLDGQCEFIPCEMTPVLFDFNEYVIRLDQEAVVEANAACLKQRKKELWRVEGHCDERGSDEYNLALGQRRAATVVRQYQALSAPREMLRVISFGEEKPVCTEPNESCWSRNRRAETVPR